MVPPGFAVPGPVDADGPSEGDGPSDGPSVSPPVTGIVASSPSSGASSPSVQEAETGAGVSWPGSDVAEAGLCLHGQLQTARTQPEFTG